MRPIDRLAQAARIKDLVFNLELLANAGKWRKDVEKFDKEQEAKDRVAKANKAIKNRRGIKD